MDQTIVLVGFMGVGKTTIGQALARKLDFQFIDTDQRIEAEMGMQTTDIFRVHGEAFFRQKEKETITQLVKKKRLFCLLEALFTSCHSRYLLAKRYCYLFISIF